jgi:hypothetical protein
VLAFDVMGCSGYWVTGDCPDAEQYESQQVIDTGVNPWQHWRSHE